MRNAYLFLLRFCPPRIRAEFGQEMLQVFDDAALDARGKGTMTYFQFCLREGFGLLANIVQIEGSMKYQRLVLQGGLAGLLIAAAIAAGLNTQSYTSTAVLRVVPKQIPDQFVSAQGLAAPDSAVEDVIGFVTSRARLTQIILQYNLFPSERTRIPIEDVVERMRESIHIRMAPALAVSFAYSDRDLAQKVTADLVSKIISEHARVRTARAVLTTQFMKETVKAAAADWEQKFASVQVAEATGKAMGRVQLDAGIARQRYEMLSAKAADAEMLSNLERRQQGPTLEVLDPPSLPSSDSRHSIAIWASAGFVAGALLAYLIQALLELWRPRRSLQSV